ncbi:head decoration protein [Streptomyces cavourensis]|nr:head decoration protein [Streptomyces cavourensis]
MLGKQTAASATSTPGGANTGNGTLGELALTGSPASGAYKVQFTSATDFAVTGPSQQAMGAGKAGTKFSGGGVEFKITAGATAFVAGDAFTITVVAAGGLWAPCVPTATDGSQVAAGILFGTTDATKGVRSATGVTRAAEVNAAELIWAAAATAEQISSGKAALATLGIVVR